MNAEKDAIRLRAALAQRVCWGMFGGFVAVVVFVLLIVVYDVCARPEGGGGLGGAFFGMQLFWTFAIGVVPVFALGAIAGTVARGKSTKAASRWVFGIAGVALTIGVPAIVWKHGVHEEVIYIHAGVRPCDLQLMNLNGGEGRDFVVWPIGEEGRGSLGSTSVTCRRGQDDEFEFTFECKPLSWKGMRIQIEPGDFLEVAATVDSEQVALPVHLSRKGEPQVVVITGRCP